MHLFSFQTLDYMYIYSIKVKMRLFQRMKGACWREKKGGKRRGAEGIGMESNNIF